MGEIIAYILSPVLLFGLTWLLFGRHSKRKVCPETISACLAIDEQLLDETERRLAEYDIMIERIRSERRDAALKYLREVNDDYLRIEALLTRLAGYLPELTVRGELARLSLGIRFRFALQLSRLQVQFGFLPATGLAALTSNLRLLSEWAERALDEISRTHGLPVLESDLKSCR